HRIAPGREHDRDRGGCSFRRKRGIEVADDRGHRPAKHIGHPRWQPIELIVGPAVFDCDILALYEARFLQALAERGHEVRRVGGRRAADKPDHWHRRLLRARRKWPSSSRAAEQRDELAPPHSITSSACSRNDSGTTSPSAFAVLRFMTSANLVGCIT